MTLRGVILAGGTGSRLGSLTRCINKHLLPVGPKPMIFHAVEHMVGAGILDIMIVTGTEHMGMIVQTLGSGSEFGCNFNYAVQEGAKGIPDAMYRARLFCDDKKFCVVLGDNVFFDSLSIYVKDFESQTAGSRIVLKRSQDLERFGVAYVDAEKKITKIREKPKLSEHPIPPGASAYAITGIYFYHAEVFDVIKNLKPSARNELEVTDIHNTYLSRGQLDYSIMEGPWTDAGTFSSLSRANALFS
jgi:glucose-1-phosphate thymidylyltransferase